MASSSAISLSTKIADSHISALSDSIICFSLSMTCLLMLRLDAVNFHSAFITLALTRLSEWDISFTRASTHCGLPRRSKASTVLAITLKSGSLKKDIMSAIFV
ncbi:MAG: hypothetical protein BWY32_03609 [bacterium ADurb.Bin243]|nr:MAG: hypothetical protein BWY32_03609 [bacterium ADurb.Bin243]